MTVVPRALTIAGSDSGGCAGIQADLKTFAALRVHGCSVVTSVTAQDTRRVYEAVNLPPDLVEKQIQAVCTDIGTDATKTGMLASGILIERVADSLKKYQVPNLVIDPVMISTGGDRLMEPEAIDVLVKSLFPLALIVTPNLREAEALCGSTLRSDESIWEAARFIHTLGPSAVVITGGHLEEKGQANDFFFDGKNRIMLQAKRLATQNTHGSGCTFSAAIAAYLARGCSLEEALRAAKKYVTEAIRHSLSIGSGRGPLGHFFHFWTDHR